MMCVPVIRVKSVDQALSGLEIVWKEVDDVDDVDANGPNDEVSKTFPSTARAAAVSPCRSPPSWWSPGTCRALDGNPSLGIDFYGLHMVIQRC